MPIRRRARRPTRRPARGEFIRRKYLQSERMYLIAHRGSQRGVNHLVTLQGSLSDKSSRDDQRLKMHVIGACDLGSRIRYTRLD